MLVRLLTMLIQGRRLEILELAALVVLLPQLIVALGPGGLGALVVAEGSAGLVCALVRRMTGRQRLGPSATAALAVVVAGTAGVVGAASPTHMAALCLAALGAGPRARASTYLQGASAGTIRALGGGAALARLATAAMLAGPHVGVVLVAASWLLVDVVALRWAASLRHTRSSDAGSPGPQRNDDPAPTTAANAPTGPDPAWVMWHLDEVLIAAVAGLAAVAPWAIGAWVIGRVMGLAALLERATLPLPLPRVPDGHAWRRAFDATVFGGLAIAVPVTVFSASFARLYFGVRAPWLGLFGVVVVVAAAHRAAVRGTTLAKLTPQGAGSLPQWHLVAALVGVVILGPPGALLATIATLTTSTARLLQVVHQALPGANTHATQRLLALAGPAAAGLVVGATLLAVKPPADVQTALLEAGVTGILTSAACFATFQISGRG